MMPDLNFIKILLAVGDQENIENISIFSEENCHKKIGGTERILTSSYNCEKILAYNVAIEKKGCYGKLYAVKS
jgi:hypothetical protein